MGASMSDTERAIAVMDELESKLRKLSERPMTLEEVAELTAACKRAADQLKAIVSRGHVH